LSLETAEGDAHSGIAGGLARNPLAELMQLVAELHDARSGRVRLPGFYVKRWVRKRNPDVVVRTDAGPPPYRADVSGPLAEALARAVRSAFGKRPTFVRGGGTIGAVASLERVLRCPVLFLDLSLPEHRYHGVNEHFDWGQASGGIVAFACLLGELAGSDGALAAGSRRTRRRR
jgi:acetylornithine deacetylase/succinyl-diaminopimelate desuccinylase-like protein